MKEKVPKKYDPYSGGCPMVLVQFLAPGVVDWIRERAEKRWIDYLDRQKRALKQKFEGTPEGREKLEGLLASFGIGEHVARYSWSVWSEEMVVNVAFDNPATMRAILDSSELRPRELLITKGEVDERGLWGSVSFIAGSIDGTNAQLTYNNYLWGEGGYLLGSKHHWEDFGYERKGRVIRQPLSELWRLKEDSETFGLKHK